MNIEHLAAVACSLVLWAAALLLRDRFAPPRIGPGTIKFTHVLPSILQVILFAYWSMYSRAVIEHVPVLAAHLCFAYAFDFLLAWTRGRPYRPSFGPVPIVLSMNLFVWFPPSHMLLGILGIAIALSSKAFLLAGGRHVFNPSVLGVVATGVLCIALPQWFRYEDISHDFDRPPLMAHLIVVLALVPQIRLATAPVALGAALSMFATPLAVYGITGDLGGPSPNWPSWLLAITLLAGDPATIPSRPVARLLFGLFLGFGFYLVSRLLLFYVGTDFFSKVIPIPVANLLVPWFERAGWWLFTRWPSLSSEGGNRAYVAVWVSVIAFLILNR